MSLARRFLEDQVYSGGLSNYSLSLTAYALALANSPASGTALMELRRRADVVGKTPPPHPTPPPPTITCTANRRNPIHADGVTMWSSSAGPPSPDWPPRSAQVEMTSYVLMALFRRGDLVEGIALMKWLSEQRNHLGSYGTTQVRRPGGRSSNCRAGDTSTPPPTPPTQDTVVALQALAYYAAFSGARAIDLGLSVSTPTTPVVSQLHINSTNFLAYQNQEVGGVGLRAGVDH